MYSAFHCLHRHSEQGRGGMKIHRGKSDTLLSCQVMFIFWRKTVILLLADILNSMNHSLIASHIPVYLLLQSLQRKQNKSWYCGHLNRRIYSCFSVFTMYSICMLKRRLNLNSMLFPFPLGWAFWNMNIWGDKHYLQLWFIMVNYHLIEGCKFVVCLVTSNTCKSLFIIRNHTL